MSTVRSRRITILMWLAGGLMLHGWAGGVMASSGSPDNAALLYYQASLNRSDLSIPEGFHSVLGGSDPGSEMLEFFRGDDYRLVIELTMAATRIPRCDWGLWVSGQWSPGGVVISHLRPLVFLLTVHARMLVAEGEYGGAIEAIAALRRFGRHLGDETYFTWVFSDAAEGEAFKVAQYLLGKAPPDADMLSRLESELADDKGPGWRPRQTLRKWCDMEVASMRASIDRYSDWREAFLARLEENSPRRKGDAAERLIENAAAPQDVLDPVQGTLTSLADSAVGVFESDASYHAKHEQIAQLFDKMVTESEAGDIFALAAGDIGFLEAYYRLHVNMLAHAHAVQAAIPIYRIRATTGQLPRSLPVGLPKDPYSGEDFGYRVTDEGFSLICRGLAIRWSDDIKPRQFDFRVKE